MQRPIGAGGKTEDWLNHAFPLKHFPMQRIADEKDLAHALKELGAREPCFMRLVELVGLPALRTAEPGYRGLIRIVVDQMISLKAAEAIWQRMERNLGPLTPENLIRRRDTTLRKAGLSGGKIRAIQAITKAVRDGSLDLDNLDRLDDATAMAKLTALPGVGPWTAEIYLLFCLGRADIWPAGDVALQHAVHHALGLNARPDAGQMRQLAESWRPFRGAAALILWNYYRHLRGIPPA
jgi:DNA-3-methyladenine glycosylase II